MARVPAGLLLGFVVGAVLGLAWGRTAKGNMDKAVTVDRQGAKVSVTFDGAEFARAGLPDLLR